MIRVEEVVIDAVQVEEVVINVVRVKEVLLDVIWVEEVVIDVVRVGGAFECDSSRGSYRYGSSKRCFRI